MPEGAQQLRPFALGDDVPGELLDGEIQRDEVVNLPHLARRQLGVDLGVALSAGHDLTPRLGGQGVGVGRGFVPATALGYVVDAGGNFVGQIERRVEASCRCLGLAVRSR